MSSSRTVSNLPIPPAIEALAERVIPRGGRVYVVGGGVRDHLMGRTVKDVDVEVFGVPADDLEKLLRKLGHVNAVGKSIGVFKLKPRGSPRHEPEIDVSIPRRDSNKGPGHKGIHVEGDPTMSLPEAARRRDLTINALMVDVAEHTLVDTTGGMADLEAGRLRAVDHDTFLEDPLRALRVVQFAARTGFSVDAELIALCREATLDELPAERVQGEWSKLMLRSAHPSWGLRVAREAGIFERVFPGLVDDPALDAALDFLAAGPRDTLEGDGRRWAVMLTTWLARTPTAGVRDTLDRLWLHRVGGYAARERLLEAHAALEASVDSDPALRQLSTRCELAVALLARQALGDATAPTALIRARTLGIAHAKPAPLLLGRDLKELGVAPGPAMGRILKQVYTAQLDGSVTTPAEARDHARRLLES